MRKHKPLLRIEDLTHVQSQNFFEITYDGHRKGGSLLQACAFPDLIIDNATPFAGYGGSELFVGMLANHAKHRPKTWKGDRENGYTSLLPAEDVEGILGNRRG